MGRVTKTGQRDYVTFARPIPDCNHRGIAVILVALFDRLFEALLAPILRRIIGAPAINAVNVIMANVGVRRSTGQHCHLQLGDPAAQPGMFINVVFQPPAQPGQVEFVQIVRLVRRRSPGPTGNNQIFTSDGEWVLDTRDPYGGLTFPMAPGPGLRSAELSDSPGVSCVAYLGEAGPAVRPHELVSASDDFRAFIMWRPNRLNGRFRFALGHVDWHWDGEATIIDQNEDCSSPMNPAGQIGRWKRTSPADRRSHVRHVPDMRRQPRWSRTTRDIDWRDA